VPLTVQLGYPLLCAGSTWSDTLGRTIEGMGLSYGTNLGGIYQDINRMAVTAVSGMNLSIDLGTAVVPSSAGVTNGCYRVTAVSASTVTVAAADPTNPRIDLVVAGVQDNGNSTSYSYVGLVTGTPAGSPSPPATPSNAIVLAQVRVNAGVSSITSGNITDLRTYQAAPGGILPLPSTTSPPSGVNGQYAYDAANDRLFHLAASGPRQLRTLPWAPVYATRNSNFAITTSVQTVLSVSFTTDGATDIKITAHWVGVAMASPTTIQVRFTTVLDGTQLDETDVMTNTAAPGNVPHAGGTAVYTTSSASGDTPGAGTHTVTLQVIANFTGSYILANSTRNTFLRVEPVSL
jgi:hypothetical protein